MTMLNENAPPFDILLVEDELADAHLHTAFRIQLLRCRPGNEARTIDATGDVPHQSYAAYGANWCR